MLCPQRQRLVKEYQTAVNTFKDSVLALKDLQGFEFDEAYEITRAALDGTSVSTGGCSNAR